MYTYGALSLNPQLEQDMPVFLMFLPLHGGLTQIQPFPDMVI